MVDLLFKPVEQFQSSSDIEKQFNIHVDKILADQINQKLFIHKMLLKKHSKKTSTIELSKEQFGYLLMTLQFVCLSFLQAKNRDLELLLDIIHIASCFKLKKRARTELLVEKLNKLAV